MLVRTWGTPTELSRPQQLVDEACGIEDIPHKPVAGPAAPNGCPKFAPAYVGRKRWAKPLRTPFSIHKPGYCFSPRSFNIGFTLGSVPSHALYMAARSSVFPRDRTMWRNRSPFSRVNPPWSRNH